MPVSPSLPLSTRVHPSIPLYQWRDKGPTLYASRECGTLKVTRLLMVVLWLCCVVLCCVCLSILPSLFSPSLSLYDGLMYTPPLSKRDRERDREIDRRQKTEEDRQTSLSIHPSIHLSIIPHFSTSLLPLFYSPHTHSSQRCSMRSWSQALVSGHSHSSHPLPERSEYNQLRNLSTLVSIP